MGDRPAERGRLGALGIHMDELVVLGDVGEPIDAVLIDRDPQQVWDVLSEGWAYAEWVAGTQHIRDVGLGHRVAVEIEGREHRQAFLLPAGDVAQDSPGYVDDVVLVSEEQMLEAIAILLMEEHVLAEPAGAASTAALLKAGEGYGDFPVLLVSGANIPREVLKRAL